MAYLKLVSDLGRFRLIKPQEGLGWFGFHKHHLRLVSFMTSYGQVGPLWVDIARYVYTCLYIDQVGLILGWFTDADSEMRLNYGSLIW